MSACGRGIGFPQPIDLNMRNILVLGGGSAGFLTALTLKTRLPEARVTLLRSKQIGIIGVGEGSVPGLLEFIHGECGIPPAEFYKEVRPTLKAGVHFKWGPRETFNYPFTEQSTGRAPELPKTNGFYGWDDFTDLDLGSAMMSRGRIFERQPDGCPKVLKTVGYHLENEEFVACLERHSIKRGVIIREETVADVELRAGAEPWVESLLLEDGGKVTADLFLDASGFVSRLLGKTFAEPFISYRDSLFCDRAVVGGWARNSEPIHPYTTAETMDAGWCWQIEHENRINRGYVYSSDFISDGEAEDEFRRKNPKLTSTRIVPFVSGRYERGWVGNVVAIGNASGFVEPLEATAMLIICQQAGTLVKILAATDFSPGPEMIASYNRLLGGRWDEVRDFLSIHYRFNTRLDTIFWKVCRQQVAMHGAERIVDFYQDCGPMILMACELLSPGLSIFQLEGFFTILIGQKVPFRRSRTISADEMRIWESVKRRNLEIAEQAMTVEETLAILHLPEWSWTPGFYNRK